MAPNSSETKLSAASRQSVDVIYTSYNVPPHHHVYIIIMYFIFCTHENSGANWNMYAHNGSTPDRLNVCA